MNSRAIAKWWMWIVLVVIVVLIVIAPLLIKQLTEDKSSQMPISSSGNMSDFNFNTESITFGPREKERQIDLKPGAWSPRIFLNQPRANYFVGDVPDTTIAWFKDGSKFTIVPGRNVDFGMRFGIFRLLGKSPVVVGYK